MFLILLYLWIRSRPSSSIRDADLSPWFWKDWLVDDPV